jgi:glucose/mannose transport system permease protein
MGDMADTAGAIGNRLEARVPPAPALAAHPIGSHGASGAPARFDALRVALYALLFALAVVFLMPVYVMLVNSLKPLDEIRSGNLMALPQLWTIDPWLAAWSTAQIGVQPTGLKPYFLNSFLLVVPAVMLSTLIGAVNGYILTQFTFRGAQLLFAAMLFSVFIPYQVVLIPMAKTLGVLGLAGTVKGLVFVNVVYGLGFTTLFFRNYYAAFPNELVRSARMDGAGFFGVFRHILLPNSAPIIVVTVIWQFTNIWNEFLFGASFSDYSSFPITVALNNLVNSSTGVKEYNVHFAGAFIAALPTLVVYLVSGKYFVRGLMAGSVKG